MIDQRFAQTFRILRWVFLSAAIVIPPVLCGGAAPYIPEILRQWNPDATPASKAGSAIKKSVDHYAEKRYEEALSALSGIQGTGVIGDYVLMYRAKSNLALKRYPEALADFRLLEKQYPTSSLSQDAVMGQCQALLGLIEPDQVLALLEKYPQYAGMESSYYQARAFHLNEKKEKASELYLQVYSKYPESSLAAQAQEYLLKLSPEALSRANNYAVRLQRAENLVVQKNFSSARTLLLALAQFSAPSEKIAQKRNLLRAETEYNLNHTEETLAALNKIKTEDAAIRARVLYLEGASRRRMKQDDAFIALRNKALKLYPNSPDTEELCHSVATYYDVNYESRKAADAWEILINAFPNGQYREKARWKTAFYAWLDARYDKAANEFQLYLHENPTPSPAASALYWMGKSHAKLGYDETARALFEHAQNIGNNSYYGWRAKEALLSTKSASSAGTIAGIDLKKVREACDSVRFSSVSLPDPDADVIKLIEKARQLANADLENFALSELRWGIRQYSRNSKVLYYAMSQISAEKDNHYVSISSMRNVFPDYVGLAPDALAKETWRLLYPLRHSETVSKHAKATGLDTALILGLIRQESAFNSKAKSKADARGLMQLLPATARQTATRVNIPRARAENLFDPEINITLGVAYFSQMLNKYEKPEFALAAYNAGGSRVERWRQEFGDADIVEFVERIPFNETRNYVKQVLGNAAQYKTLFASLNP